MRKSVGKIDWAEDETEIRLRCGCHSETLSVTGYADGEEDLLYLTMEARSYRGKLPWKIRLRHIWKILRQGEPYEDQMVLHVDDAQAFGDLLKQLSERVRQAYLSNPKNAPASKPTPPPNQVVREGHPEDLQ